MRGKSKQSDTSIVVMKRANKEGKLSAESVERRDGAKGNSAHQSTDRTQSRITVTQAGVGYGGRRDLPSLPEVGAVCLNGHARICAGGAGQPVSLPRLLAAERRVRRRRMGDKKVAPPIHPSQGALCTAHPFVSRIFSEETRCAPGGIRTPDPRIRSPLLCPAELRARSFIINSLPEFFL